MHVTGVMMDEHYTKHSTLQHTLKAKIQDVWRRENRYKKCCICVTLKLPFNTNHLSVYLRASFGTFVIKLTVSITGLASAKVYSIHTRLVLWD